MAVSQNGKDWQSDIADAGFREAWQKQLGNEIANQCNATTREGHPGAIYTLVQSVVDEVAKKLAGDPGPLADLLFKRIQDGVFEELTKYGVAKQP